jgi:uncharacterized protein (TIGR02246 family)
MTLKTGLAITMAAALTTLSSNAVAQHEGHGAMADSAAVASVVAKYHEALATGDSAAALTLLSDDAVILESGSVETRAEYRSHHLPADISFAKAIRSQHSAIHVRVRGELAWSTSTTTTQGETNGRAVNSMGAELMVLVRTPGGWKISAIHWSSRQRRAG